MKKLICVLLCAALVFFLCACGLQNLKDLELPPLPKVTEVITTPKPTATPEPVVVTPEPTLAPTELELEPAAEEPLGLEGQVAVRYKHTEYEQFDPEEGTQRILTFAYDSPYVTIYGNQEATAVLNGQLAFMDESFYLGGSEGDGFGFNGLLEMAEDNYAYARQSGDSNLPMEYSSTRTVTPKRIDSNMVSFLFSYADYSGGSHSNYSDVGCVFDTHTGEQLCLEDLSSDYDKLANRLVHELVSLTSTDESLYQHVFVNYMNDDFHGTLGKLLRPGAWYFDENGMVFTSSLYELGPYSAGLAVFHIPYSKIRDVIDERWLPEERSEAGSLRIAALDAGQEGRLSYLDRIEADKRGGEFCLIAEGSVYDLKLSRVFYSNEFVENEQLWFCSQMQDSAVQVKARIPEGMPDLMLSYTDQQGNSYQKLITGDTENNVYQLTDRDSVSPVG